MISAKWHATGCAPPRARHERRLLLRADLLRLPAARPEAAAGRRVRRARHVSLEHDPRALAALGRGLDRHRREERLRVRMHRRVVDLLARPDLDDLAEVHHRDPVGDVADDREVVRDEEVREPELALQLRRAGSRPAPGSRRRARRRARRAPSARGFSASARATPMRWRWPPENSCGKRFACSGLRADRPQELLDAAPALAPR